MQVTSLRFLYIQELERSCYPDPTHSSGKLKARIENHEINELIGFSKVNSGDKNRITYYLVYNASISVADIVTYA